MQSIYYIIGITYAGNHGNEIEHADGSTFTQKMPADYQLRLQNLLDALNKEVNYFHVVFKNILGFISTHPKVFNYFYFILIYNYRFVLMELGLKIKAF